MEFCRPTGRTPRTVFVPNRCRHREHDLPGGFARTDCSVWRFLKIRWIEEGRSSAGRLYPVSLQCLGLFRCYVRGPRGVPVEERALAASPRMLIDVTGVKAIWTEAGFRGDEAYKESILYLQGDLTKAPQKFVPPAVCASLGPGGVDGHFWVHRCSSFRHGQSWEPDCQYRSHHPKPTIDFRRESLQILPLSYCFGASLVHTHLYQGRRRCV